MRMMTVAIVLGLAAAGGKGDISFRNGQPASVAFTAGGTSPPCTGLYCQDNPLGNPCPCPVWKPCKHDNIPDSHCMYRVNIEGRSMADEQCETVRPGTWSAEVAGQENRGEIKRGCMCTAGSSDTYESKMWPICNKTNPQWCDEEGKGNACPPMDCDFFWGPWSTCSATCGGGTQTRVPFVNRKGLHGGSQCPAPETRRCSTKKCPAPAPPSGGGSSSGGGKIVKCPSKKEMQKQEEANNMAQQVRNMREGLRSAKDGFRDVSSERCNRVSETYNLMEEMNNTPLLSCSGVHNCYEAKLQIDYNYAVSDMKMTPMTA